MQTRDQDLDWLAASYVLGHLNVYDQRRVELLSKKHARLAHYIAEWELRLGRLVFDKADLKLMTPDGMRLELILTRLNASLPEHGR